MEDTFSMESQVSEIEFRVQRVRVITLEFHSTWIGFCQAPIHICR